MKKNTMMRIASVLLVVVLLTTSVISGTFAKYVTSDKGSDFARVAKWGVAIEAKSFGLFEADYKTDDTSATFSGNYSVSSAGTVDRDDVLAPGTSGSFADIAITGTPEVAVDVKIVPTVAISDTWKDGNGAYYCPVVVTVNDTEFFGTNYASATAFAAAIEENIKGKSAQYAPNTDLASIYNNTNLDIKWKWDFTTGDINDIRDTALGNAAANATTEAEELTISIGVDITVTQID